MPNGPQKITGITFDPSTCQSEHSITDEDIKKLLTTSTKKKPNKKKKATTAKDEKVSNSPQFLDLKKFSLYTLENSEQFPVVLLLKSIEFFRRLIRRIASKFAILESLNFF